MTKSTLMLSELNVLPTVGTIITLVDSVIEVLVDSDSKRSIYGQRVYVEIACCGNALSRTLATRKSDEMGNELIDEQALLVRYFLEEDVPFTQPVTEEELMKVQHFLNKVMRTFANLDNEAGCDDDHEELCDYHTKMMSLLQAALTLAMLRFQSNVTTTHLCGDMNRSDPGYRVSVATAELIRTWRCFPYLREAIEAIQPTIVVEGENGNPVPAFLRQAE